MTIPNHRISVAPMMDCTDRHDRYFLRLIAPNVLLYTEMITAQAIKHGDKQHLLAFNATEHPVALQLGGSDPVMLADAAKVGESFGYDEINLNVGCPSSRVSAGRFGACLMLEPQLVADCIAAMRNAVKIPVTVKCRIGVDEQEDYESLVNFIQLNASAGCETFIVHARKAWLNGLSPRENREIPPLKYGVVHRIKKKFPALNIIINGGFNDVAAIKQQLDFVDGVMIGRAAYSNPYILAEIEKEIFGNNNVLSRREVAIAMMPYIREQLSQGIRLASITRHLFGLFLGQPGAAFWRRYLSENAYKSGVDENVLVDAMSLLHM
jgi:tRNA-dihydrouridine synthase A